MENQENSINEVVISYKSNPTAVEPVNITSAKHAAEVLYNLWDKDTIEVHEAFKVLLLNNAHKVKGIYEVSSGSITGTLVDIRILMAVVIKTLSTAIVLCHNHPSGKLFPSDPDLKITKRIQQAARYFDVKVLDHLIITPSGDYYSFADECLL